MKIFCFILLIFQVYEGVAFAAQKKTILKDETSIQFAGKSVEKIKALECIDKSLKLYGNFGVYGNFSAGVKSLLKDNYLEIKQMSQGYHVSIVPKSGTGHDFSFQVDSANGHISNLAVGEIAPRPKE